MAPKTNDEWAPTTREEWTELFADGFGLARSRAEEADAKAAAAKAEADKAAGKPDNEGDVKPSFRERLLGL